MKRYIEQVIEDLEELAKNPPAPAYIEIPEQIEAFPFVAELALVPFKTMEEWTGYEAVNFPESYDLEEKQIENLITAIFVVFESIFVELIDIPKEIPSKWLYEALINEWKHTIIQYLPSSGMDLEFCTGNWHSCPYGEYCDCYDEEEENEGFEVFEKEHKNRRKIPNSNKNSNPD